MNASDRTLLIVNPTSKVGQGAVAGKLAASILGDYLDELECVETTAPLHAVEIAASAESFDAVIALGGDGVIHETANGLMRIPAEKRPKFGIIPVGSGNDYARTLHISEDVKTACEQLIAGTDDAYDVGRVNDDFFVETLSFGLDAAIALETVELRQHTDKTGTALYFQAGIDQLSHHRVSRSYTVSFDGEPVVSGSSLTFAVQIGRTYGGGFIICPDADPSDGLFDICIASGDFSMLKAISLFAKAKDGKHVGHKQIAMRRASTVTVDFAEEVPAQMDGEDCTGSHYEVSIEPGALRVIHA